MVIKTFRLQENLMRVTVTETDNFIFDGRAVTGTPASDCAGINC